MAQSPQHAARVLGLLGEPTLQNVKRARRDLAMKYHPDARSDTKRATRHMARINAAADTLIKHLENGTKPTDANSETNDHKRTEDGNVRGQQTRQASRSAENPFPRQHVRPAKENKPYGSPHTGRHVDTDTASEAQRGAWKSERMLAEQTAASYRSVLNAIGKQEPRPRVDLQILRFDYSKAG